jgi:hypothetical protein
MTPDEMKTWIDKATYESLLSRVRFAPIGDPIFQGEMGEYFSKVMARKREEVGEAGHVSASKTIGWEKP